MNRRNLFRLTAGVLVTPDELWVPKRKLISLPARAAIIEPYKYVWSWESGGSGIVLTDLHSKNATFYSTKFGEQSGVARCEITDSKGLSEIVVVQVRLNSR